MSKLEPTWLLTTATDLAVLLALVSCYFITLFPPHYTGVFTLALFALLTVWMLLYWRATTNAPNAQTLNRVLILGVIARCTLVATDPFTTHDVERYLWDGAVLLNGFDPYIVAPDNPLIAELRAIWPTPEEHAAYPTLYPPIALAFFALSALAGPVAGVLVWKVLATAASIAGLLLMANILKTLKCEEALPLVALSPLMLIEVGIGGHLDVFTSLSVAGALWALLRAKWLILGVALGLGAGVKLLPIVLFAPLVIALPLRSSLLALAGGALGLLSCYGTALAFGLEPIGSLGVFFTKWEFGSPLYSLLQSSSAITDPRSVLVGLAVVASTFALWLARANIISGMIAMLAVPLLLSPVVFPWYLLVLIPLVALRPNAFLLLWLSLAPLSYEVLDQFAANGSWEPATWPLWCIAGGWLVGMVLYFKTTPRPTPRFEIQELPCH